MQLTPQLFLPLAFVGIVTAAAVPARGAGGIFEKQLAQQIQLLEERWDAVCADQAKAHRDPFRVDKSNYVSKGSWGRSTCKVYDQHDKIIDVSDDARESYDRRYNSDKVPPGLNSNWHKPEHSVA